MLVGLGSAYHSYSAIERHCYQLILQILERALSAIQMNHVKQPE